MIRKNGKRFSVGFSAEDKCEAAPSEIMREQRDEIMI